MPKSNLNQQTINQLLRPIDLKILHQRNSYANLLLICICCCLSQTANNCHVDNTEAIQWSQIRSPTHDESFALCMGRMHPASFERIGFKTNLCKGTKRERKSAPDVHLCELR